ncbi:MAG: hypothetical protein JRI76_05690 [Deltaproteobacteria bacterium]|nr:hypothetical protein [Deltaproteobacteria bacterium]MBW2131599.1 hypothetical protein [Deltaproteobacteria bacterium]
MRMIRPFHTAVYACLLILFVICTTSASAPLEHANARKILHYGTNVSRIGSFDPHLASASSDRAIADMLFNGLLRYRPGMAPEIEPDLAVTMPDMQMINGKQVWTFNLKKGVLFHPGTDTEPYPLTADDVIFSFKKASNPAFSAYAGEYAGMTFEKAGDHTVRIVLEKPLSSILFFPKVSNYSGGFIVSKRAIESKGYGRFKAHPAGTGPFAFKEYIPGEKVILSAHDRYFRGKPRLSGVEVALIPEIEKREAALRAGSLDVVVGSANPVWLEQIRNDAGVVLDLHGVGEVVTVHLNTTKKPLNDRRIRKAILYALDREAFIRAGGKLMIEGVYSPVPPQLMPGGISDEEIKALGLDYAVDISKARRMLAEAGFPDGFSLKAICSEIRFHRLAYDLLGRQLEAIGVHCRIEIVPHVEMHRRIRADESDIVVYGAFRPNADAYLTQFFHSDSIVVSGRTPDTNFSHYAGADALIEAARAEIDPESQIRLWVHAQIKILSDAVAYPLFSLIQCQLRGRHVDYGHPLKSSMALYPQFTEATRMLE